MDVFINGIGNVSPQLSSNNDEFLKVPINNFGRALWCVDPDYKSFLKGVNLRRLSRLVKFGIYSAQKCIEDAGQKNLDAIITGTGLGCQADTEKFLSDIYMNEEGVLSPTKFIQSTHNTLSGQIAMMLNCENYNFTYVHRGASFESALLDGMMLIYENANNVLVGGLDELTENYLTITGRMNMWRKSELKQFDLFDKKMQGTIAGEGAAFFMLGKKKSSQTYARIKGIKILFKPKSTKQIVAEINSLLEEHNLDADSLDVLVLGKSGDNKQDELYSDAIAEHFTEVQQTAFKHLCGEYKTASAFGMWTAAQMIKKKEIPSVLKLNDKSPKTIGNVLIYNCYNKSNHSLLLLQDV